MDLGILTLFDGNQLAPSESENPKNEKKFE
jgi:hypothetical protein